MNKLTMKQTFNKLKFKTVKNAPTILMIAGVAGVVGAGVLVGKSTLKLAKVLDESKNNINSINDAVEDESIEYTQEDATSDLKTVKVNVVVDTIKLYTPAVILGGVSIACMIQSHNILRKRNLALAAAFTTISESFKKYRKEVVNRYGERADFEIKNGIRKEQVEIEETDKNGKTKKKKTTIDVAGAPSDYARFFDENCSYWDKDPEYNLMFLKAQQQYANDKLIAQGYLFLNDVYDMLGIPSSKEGQVVGWIYNLENPNGDNYVDFGIYDTNVEGFRNEYANDSISEERIDFVNGYRSSILLDFNVDGNVWEKM